MRPKVKIAAAAFIIGITLIAYFPAIRGGFIWDDPDYVLNNDNLRSLDGLFRIWFVPKSSPQYYPLVHTTFWIEYHLWQLKPTGYHIVNVLLHIGSALLLWKLLTMLDVPGAWLAACVFAIHPVHVESVAWITERKNVLSGIFYFASAISYLKFESTNGRRDLKWYIAAIGFFTGALLSKTVTATLPAAILVVLWWKRGRLTRREILPLIPFFLLGVSFGMITAYLETHFVGATGQRITELNLSIAQRILIAGRVVWFYAWKLIWPHPLVFIYPRWDVDARVWWQWLFPIGVVLALVILWLNRKRWGRAPLAAALIFVGTLFPVLGFLNVYPMRFSYVADHFQYLASVGLVALFSAALTRLINGWAAVILIPLAALAFQRGFAYADAETLWRDTLARNPDSWMVRTNLGHIFRDRGEYEKAFDQYQRALELAPELHDTHTNVGMMLGYWGKDPEAIAHLDAALRINPDFAPAHYSLGLIYKRQGKIELAEKEFGLALRSAPHYPLANFELAKIFEQRGQIKEATEHYRTAATWAPDDRDTRYNLGVLLIQLRQWDEAIHNLQQAVRIDPNYAEAWFNLGQAQLAAGKREEGIRSFERALRLKPELSRRIKPP